MTFMFRILVKKFFSIFFRLVFLKKTSPNIWLVNDSLSCHPVCVSFVIHKRVVLFGFMQGCWLSTCECLLYWHWERREKIICFTDNELLHLFVAVKLFNRIYRACFLLVKLQANICLWLILDTNVEESHPLNSSFSSLDVVKTLSDLMLHPFYT